MQNRTVLVLTLLLSFIVYSEWSIASGGCHVDKGVAVQITTATITFRDGSVRFLKNIELQYEYVYEADKRYFNPAKHRANKRELFVGMCAPNTQDELVHAGMEISKISLVFKAEYSYTPDKVRLLLTDGKEFVVKGRYSYQSPLVPPHDFLDNKSEGDATPEISVFRLLLVGTDADSNTEISAVVYDSTEHHDSNIQIMSIQIKPEVAQTNSPKVSF